MILNFLFLLLFLFECTIAKGSMRMQKKNNKQSRKNFRRSGSGSANTPSRLNNTLRAADVVLAPSSASDLSNGDSFNTFLFKENHSIYKMNTLLQQEGRELEVIQALNSSQSSLHDGLYVQIGSRQYYVYYDFDQIKSKFPVDQKDYLKNEHIQYILQDCINNIGIFMPYIIEESRYNMNNSMQDIKVDELNKDQEKDIDKKISEEELLVESLHLFNQISEMPEYIVFNYFLGNSELLNKIIIIILYELTKNKKNNTYKIKNTFQKIVDYFAAFNETVSNLPIIHNSIDTAINELSKFDDLYKKSKVIIYNLIYKIIKFNEEKPLFSLSNILEKKYFIKITKDAYRDSKAIVKSSTEDSPIDKQNDKKEISKNKQIFQNIKKFFLPN
jgi:hypothetical protein